MKCKLFPAATEKSSSKNDKDTKMSEVVRNLKIKFSSCTSRMKKIMLITFNVYLKIGALKR